MRMTSRRAFFVILPLALVLFLPSDAFSQAKPSQQPLSLQEYISELDRCSIVLTNSGNDPAALHTLRISIPPQWTVKAGDQSYDVATDWLTDGIAEVESKPASNAAALQQTQQKLAAYREAAQAIETPVPSQTIEHSRATLNGILAAKEFQAIRGPTWLDVLKARIYAWIERLLEKLFGGIGHQRAIGNAIAWTVIALTALLLALWAVRASFRAGARSQMDLSGASAAGQDWHYWLREAMGAAARGDYRSAIHAAYWAAVARLEETKSLPEDRSRTPRESLRLMRRDSAEYAPLSQLTRRFELVWYGYRSANATDWSDAMQQLETLGCLRSSTPAISGS